MAKKKILVLLGLFSFGFLTGMALANPVLSNIGAGQITIQQTPGTTIINQGSARAILNWQSFNIGPTELTHFQQPMGGSALNRISAAQGASQIYGRLTATGQIILINPAGVFFGPSAFVNVGGLIATTANISDYNYLNGNYVFDQISPYSGAIINEGQIIARDNGLIALVAPGVVNRGMIQANLGHVILASGEAFTMNFSGDGLVNFAITAKTTRRGRDPNGNELPDGVLNTGSLIANGGTVLVSAQAARGVLDNAINMKGIVEAKSVYQKNGEIIFSADPNAGAVHVAANINASGKGANEQGGNVKITGKDILIERPTVIDVSGSKGGGNIIIGRDAIGNLAHSTTISPGVSLIASTVDGNGGLIETSGKNLSINGVNINTSSQHGKTGTWLIDPADLSIVNNDNTTATFSDSTYSAGNNNSFLNITDLLAALNNSNVTIQTTIDGSGGNGDIFVNTPITWSTNKNLNLTAYRDINASASITNTGGASVSLIADNTGTGIGTVKFAPSTNVTLSGGSGKVSIYYNPVVFGNPELIYSGGTTPTAYMLINRLGNEFDVTGASLANLSNRPFLWSDRNYALSKDIDASPTATWHGNRGFSPIGLYNFGTFQGQFDGQNHVISNLYLTPSAPNDVVGFFGASSGTIKNLSLINEHLNFRLPSGGYDVGGLVGDNYGTISNVSTNVVMQFTGGNQNWVGGIAGYNTGSISNSSTSGSMTLINNPSSVVVGGLVGWNESGATINNAKNSVNLNVASGATSVGGLVGTNRATITNSYNTGNVTGINKIGGLVGDFSSGTISNSYNTGSVLGQNTVGGLVGNGGNTTISNSYNTGSVTGQDRVGGLVGDSSSVISNSYNTGNVAGTSSVGGLTGINWNNISDSFSQGNVSLTGQGYPVGGLAGFNLGTISRSYATGNVTSSNFIVGGLVGWNLGPINNSYATGNVTSANNNAGGLVGTNDNSVNSSYSTGNVIGADYTGGLVGSNRGNISASYASGLVNGNQNVGGLSGDNSGTVTNSYAIGAVKGSSNVGGLVGLNTNTVTNSYNNGSVTGTNRVGGLVGDFTSGAISNSYNTASVVGQNTLGGLVGHSSGNTTISNSYNTGGVSGQDTVGGLVGDNSSVITNSYNTGNVFSNYTVGGLIGINWNNVSDSFSLGNVSGIGQGYPVGGLVGTNVGTISRSYAKGNVTSSSFIVGGLVGWNFAPINNSYATGDVTSTNNNAGGLVGTNENSITSSYSTGNVIGADYTGGLVGSNRGNISASYASGLVNGNQNVGGLSGDNSGTVTNSYAIGAVNGGSNVGGLVGLNTNSVTKSYSSGRVKGIATSQGGLIGSNSGTVTQSFWDTQTSGQTTSAGGTGLTTASLLNRLTYSNAGWSIGIDPNTNTWLIFNGRTRPMLGWEYSTTINTPHALQLISINSGKLFSNYTLARDMNLNVTSNPADIWAGLGFIPVGTYAQGHFRGLFDGQNHIISNLYMSSAATNDVVGLFGVSSGTIRNLGLINEQFNFALPFSNDVGGLVGDNYGTISNVFTNVAMQLSGGNQNWVGGLAGYNAGSITNSSASGSINLINNPLSVVIGGLVGWNDSTILNAKSSVNLNVAVGATNVGGLVGTNVGTITNAYNTGIVKGAGISGGLVGINSGNIRNTYNSGLVTNVGTAVGGLVGKMMSGTVTNSFWDTQTSGQATSAAGVGATTAQLLNRSTYSNAGWVIGTDPSTNNWLIFDGLTRPMLAMEYSTSIKTPYALQLIGINSNTLSANYTLGANIDLSATKNPADIWAGHEFIPIGNPSNYFMGSLNGQNYQISNLNLTSDPLANSVGLFGVSFGTIQNLGLNSVVVSGNSNVGGLVGYNGGQITNSYIKGSVTGADTVGGLVGYNGGQITNSYINGSIKGANAVGGLAGINAGTIKGSYSAADVANTGLYTGGLVSKNLGTIINSYALGNVFGSGFDGGLAGYNSGTITNAFSMGDVKSFGSPTGGLVGYNDNGAIIANAYAIGNVTTSGSIVGGLIGLNVGGLISNSYSSGRVTGIGSGEGGLVGEMIGGSVINSYWDTQTSGKTTSAAGIGATSAQLINRSLYSNAGWNIGTDPNTNIWLILDGRTRPMLATEYSSSINNPHSLQLIGINTNTLSGNYTLANNIDLSSTSNPADIWAGGQFIPIGNASTFFRGTLNGQNNLISNLNLTSYTSVDNVGLIGVASGTIQNVGLSSVTVSGKNNVGALAGINYGNILNSFSTGSVKGVDFVGGLVGDNEGKIIGSYSTADLSNTGTKIGGLAGQNLGIVRNSFAIGNVLGGTVLGGGGSTGGLVGINFGKITNSFSSGNVTGFGNPTGGLVGYHGNDNNAIIRDSYATGNVTSNSNRVGGLVGRDVAGTIINSYSSGYVTGTGIVANQTSSGQISGLIGGFVGAVDPGYVSINNFWDFQTSGRVYSGEAGLVNGKTTSQLLSLATYKNAGWDIGTDPSTNTWLIIDGFTRPMLAMEYSTSISTPHSLQLMGVNSNTLSGNYTLANNLDLNVTGNRSDVWGGGQFIPIGNATTPFKGSFNGQGFVINESINQPSQNNIGLFGVTASNATLSNIGVTGSVVGQDNVGMLVGLNTGAVIQNVYSVGNVIGRNGVGGLIGYNQGNISNAYSTGKVIGSGSNIGGLVGYNTDKVTTSYSAVDVISVGNLPGGTLSSVGGLIGFNQGDIFDSYAIGNVSGSHIAMGGLVGKNVGTIKNAYSTGSIIGPNFPQGGLIGSNLGNVTNSFWDTQTSGKTSSAAGTGKTTTDLTNLSTYSNAGWNIGIDPTNNTWLIFDGRTRPILAMEYSSDIHTPHSLQLLGINSNTLSGKYTLANNVDLSVTSNSADVWAGGQFIPIGNAMKPFAGTFNGRGYIINEIINLPSQNDVGLFGITSANANLSNIGLTGSVVGHNKVGMLVGLNAGTIRNIYSLGSVTANVYGGGLVGINIGPVSESYSAGSIKGSFVLGGLVGWNSGDISDSYSISPVTASSIAGGLVGVNAGNIENTYSSGLVLGQSSGGLAASNLGTISNSFWDTQTSGQASSAGGIGRTTAELLARSTYSNAGWNIGTNALTNRWLIFDGSTRPLLSMEYSKKISNGHQLQLIGINSTTLNANYALANNIDLSSILNPADIWAGKSFTLLGNSNMPFTGSFDGAGYSITHLVTPNDFIPATSSAGALTNLDISGTIFAGSMKFDFTNKNYSGGSIFNQFRLPLTSGNLTICTSCSNNLILSGNQYGNSTDLTLPVQDLIELLKLANVDIQAFGSTTNGLGDIIVDALLQSNSSRTLKLSAYRNINVNAPIVNTGGGSVILSADHTGTGTGTVKFAPGTNVSLSGGSGSVSIYYNPLIFGNPEGMYSGGTIPTAYMLINRLGNEGDVTGASLATLSNRPFLWSGRNYALSKDIDASATATWHGGNGFSPIGTYAQGLFSGQFDGQSHIISNLYLTPSTQNDVVGFFGASTGTIKNLGLVNEHLNFTLSPSGWDVGGLVGDNYGTISNVFTNVVMNFSGGSNNWIGGLAGSNVGTITNAYSTGSMNFAQIPPMDVIIGGFVGENLGRGVITKGYSTVSITGVSPFFPSEGIGTNRVGGFAGVNDNILLDAFSDTGTSGIGIPVYLGFGPTRALGGCFSGNCSRFDVPLASPLTYRAAGWDFKDIWAIIPGQSYPYLLSFYPDKPIAISGQLSQFNEYYSNPTWASLPVNEKNPLWSSLTPVALPGQRVNLISNGVILDSVLTGSNGFYYFLEKNNAISNGAPLLVSLSNVSNKANTITIMPEGGASVSNLVLALNTLLVGENGFRNFTYTPPTGKIGIFSLIDQLLAVTPYTLVTNENLASVKGNLTSNGLLYDIIGNQISINSNINFVTSPNILFGLTGDLNTTHGSITFNGPVQINPSSNSVTLQTNDGGNIQTADVISATKNPYTLKLNSANNIYLKGLLLLRDSDLTGSTITDGNLIVSAANTNQSISTSGVDNSGFIVTDFNLLKGKWFQVGGFANALDNFQINSGVMPSSIAEYLQVVSGAGTHSNPYVINSIESLQGIGSNSYTLGLSYLFTGDALTNVSYLWNFDPQTGQYKGFVPIGTLNTPFTGEFSTQAALNGVADIYINRPNMDNVGIFGVTGPTAVLSNVFVSSNAVTGHDNVGILVGLNKGTIINSYGQENFIVGNKNVGSLVGTNMGTISNSASFDSRVLGNIAGGLVGNNSGTIDKSIAAVYVGGLGSNPITGGLVGQNSGIIKDSFWDKNVTGKTLAAGKNTGVISNSHGGCFGSQCAVNLSDPATYLTIADGGLGLVSSSWDLTNTWNVQPGLSYPYINDIFSSRGTTARVTSGKLSPASANELLVAIWGILVGSNANVLLTNIGYLITGADGSFYMLNPNDTFSSSTPAMLIGALGGNIQGSVLFNVLQPSQNNPTASQINIPLLASPRSNSNPTNLLALSNVQIDNIALGLPLNTVQGDSAFYLQQEYNVVYNNGISGNGGGNGGGNGNYIPLPTPGIYFLAYVYALANANGYSNINLNDINSYRDLLTVPQNDYYYYQGDLFSDARKRYGMGEVNEYDRVQENVNKLVKNTQLQDASLIKHYIVEPVIPKWCAK